MVYISKDINEVDKQNNSVTYLDQTGKLVYKRYANEGENNAVNTMIDFSYCGCESTKGRQFI